MRLVYNSQADEIYQAYAKDHYEIMENAATRAAHHAAERILREGRAVIKAAGFSTNWTQNFRVNVYPARGDSLKPTVYAYHRIFYAGVFEEGATIKGKPLMFIPTAAAPRGSNGSRVTLRQFRRQFGPLISVRKGDRIFLVAKKKVRPGTPRASRVMFVGVPQVRIPQKWFSIDKVVEKAALEFESVYFQNLVGG